VVWAGACAGEVGATSLDIVIMFGVFCVFR
jgi:hypothetical protein